MVPIVAQMALFSASVQHQGHTQATFRKGI